MQASAHCIPIQPQYLQVGKTHGREIIGIILPYELLGMDESGKSSIKSINGQSKHTARHYLIKNERIIQNRKSACAILDLSKKYHGTLNFMHHKSDISVSKSASQIYIGNLSFNI